MIYLQDEKETLSYFSRCAANSGKLNVDRGAAGEVDADDTGSWSRLQEVTIHNITQGPFSQEHEIVTNKSTLVRNIQVKNGFRVLHERMAVVDIQVSANVVFVVYSM